MVNTIAYRSEYFLTSYGQTDKQEIAFNILVKK